MVRVMSNELSFGIDWALRLTQNCRIQIWAMANSNFFRGRRWKPTEGAAVEIFWVVKGEWAITYIHIMLIACWQQKRGGGTMIPPSFTTNKVVVVVVLLTKEASLIQ